MRHVGTLIEKLRTGEPISRRFENPYLTEALSLGEILLTAGEVTERFPQLFADPTKPIVLEIGSYLGKNLMEMAVAHPEMNFLGLDLTYKRVVKCARKIAKLNLGNARIAICDARQFVAAIPDHSLQGICLFFPDPWPKRRHEKNRLVRSEFFAIMQKKLMPKGFFWLKTDAEPYFSEAISSAEEHRWSISARDMQPHELSDQTYLTIFEELFISQNLPIHRAVFSPPTEQEPS